MSRYTKRFVRRVIGPSEHGMLPNTTDAKEALVILSDYLLDGVMINAPVSCDQAITVIVDAILQKYCREYRRDIRHEEIRQITKRLKDFEYFTEG